jgi:sugar phosphate isomerase/epimerase
MKIKIYRTLWGVPGPWDSAVAGIMDSGYDGIEAILFSAGQHAELRRVLRRRPVPFKGVIWTRNAGRSADDHLRSFRAQLGALLRTGATSINAIGGYDCWTEREAARYFEGVLEAGAASGVPVSHETHRDSALFHPTAARRVLVQFPELRLTCDFSHWVVACERLLDDQMPLIRLCGARADHIHLRVGTVQAPQVGDVRAPESAPYLRAFERMWDIVWKQQLAHGVATTTACPEFGPPPYLPTLPYSGMPVADLPAICDWQRDRQRLRFTRWISSRPKPALKGPQP